MEKSEPRHRRRVAAGFAARYNRASGSAMDRRFGRRAVGGMIAALGLYPIVTANHLQNLLSGTILFLIGVSILVWGLRR